MHDAKKAPYADLIKKKAWRVVLKIDVCTAAKDKTILSWPNSS